MFFNFQFSAIFKRTLIQIIDTLFRPRDNDSIRKRSFRSHYRSKSHYSLMGQLHVLIIKVKSTWKVKFTCTYNYGYDVAVISTSLTVRVWKEFILLIYHLINYFINIHLM